MVRILIGPKQRDHVEDILNKAKTTLKSNGNGKNGNDYINNNNGNINNNNNNNNNMLYLFDLELNDTVTKHLLDFLMTTTTTTITKTPLDQEQPQQQQEEERIIFQRIKIKRSSGSGLSAVLQACFVSCMEFEVEDMEDFPMPPSTPPTSLSSTFTPPQWYTNLVTTTTTTTTESSAPFPLQKLSFESLSMNASAASMIHSAVSTGQITELKIQHCLIEDVHGIQTSLRQWIKTPQTPSPLATSTSTKKLNLSQCQMSQDVMASMLQALSTTSTTTATTLSPLTELDISENECGVESVKALCELLQSKTSSLSSACHLQILRTRKNFCYSLHQPQQQQGVVGQPATTTTTSSSTLLNNNNNNNNIKLLANALRHNTSLKFWNLAGNQLQSKDVTHLFLALTQNMTLETLYLHDNFMDDSIITGTVVPEEGQQQQQRSSSSSSFLVDNNNNNDNNDDSISITSILSLWNQWKSLKCLWMFHNPSITVSAIQILADAFGPDQYNHLYELQIPKLMGNKHDNIILSKCQQTINYWAELNRHGRYLLGYQRRKQQQQQRDNNEKNSSDGGGSDDIPLGLWPLVLEKSTRAYTSTNNIATSINNKIESLSTLSVMDLLKRINNTNNNHQTTTTTTMPPNAIYYFLHGPATLLQRPNE